MSFIRTLPIDRRPSRSPFHLLRVLSWRLASIRTAHRFGACGSRSVMVRPFTLVGGRYAGIGNNVTIYEGARIEAFRPLDGQYSLEIGSDSVIHRGVHIGAVESVRIGVGVLMAAGCYVTDHDHDWRNPTEPAISNGRVEISPTAIGDYCWLGERVMVLKGVTVGEGAVIGAGSIVTKSIPPHVVAVGSPAKVIRRWNRSSECWEPVPRELR